MYNIFLIWAILRKFVYENGKDENKIWSQYNV